jgi:UDP-glucose-4-epimerase GalE
MRTVIVTGGCGYIGSHVVRAFKENGDKVFVIDREKRHHTLTDCDGYFIDDFSTDASLSFIVTTAPDIIVHCAGTSLVGPSMTNPSEYYDNNIRKTLVMLNVLKEMPIPPTIMFSSSASVYGNPVELPVKETAPISPISPYGSTKAMGELMLSDYGSAYGFDTVCFRYFNAAGAEPFNFDLGQEPEATHIVARILEASITKHVFSMYGEDFDTPDGTCIRDYVHVWDIALAHVKAANYLDKFLPNNQSQRTAMQLTFNLGTNKGVSNYEIMQYVSEKYGLIGVNYSPRRHGDPAKLVADATRANDILGWYPEYSDIETIIDSAYKWYAPLNTAGNNEL